MTYSENSKIRPSLKPLKFQYSGELAVDNKGVSRDVYSEFWNMFLSRYADGEDEKVPVPTDEGAEDMWRACGRILVKGFADCGFFPISLSIAFLTAAFFSEEQVSPELLLHSFLKYLTPSERDLIAKMLNEEEYDSDEYIELLSRFGCRKVSFGVADIQERMLAIAHKTIIQEPNYILHMWNEVCAEYFTAYFPDVATLQDFYASCQPTAQVVLKMMNVTTSADEENAPSIYEDTLEA